MDFTKKRRTLADEELSDWLLISRMYLIGRKATTIVYCIFMHEDDERPYPERGLHIKMHITLGECM